MEIRRIHQSEGDTVGDLWDRMCREAVDGGPLTERGRRNLSRMLAMSAWHRDAFCLVAVDGVQVIGFVNGRTSIGDGLLPGILGEIDSLYVVPEERDKGISRALAEAAVSRLRDQGADTIQYLSCADARDDRWSMILSTVAAGWVTPYVCDPHNGAGVLSTGLGWKVVFAICVGHAPYAVNLATFYNPIKLGKS